MPVWPYAFINQRGERATSFASKKAPSLNGKASIAGFCSMALGKEEKMQNKRTRQQTTSTASLVGVVSYLRIWLSQVGLA